MFFQFKFVDWLSGFLFQLLYIFTSGFQFLCWFALWDQTWSTCFSLISYIWFPWMSFSATWVYSEVFLLPAFYVHVYRLRFSVIGSYIENWTF